MRDLRNRLEQFGVYARDLHLALTIKYLRLIHADDQRAFTRLKNTKTASRHMANVAAKKKFAFTKNQFIRSLLDGKSCDLDWIENKVEAQAAVHSNGDAVIYIQIHSLQDYSTFFLMQSGKKFVRVASSPDQYASRRGGYVDRNDVVIQNDRNSFLWLSKYLKRSWCALVAIDVVQDKKRSRLNDAILKFAVKYGFKICFVHYLVNDRGGVEIRFKMLDTTQPLDLLKQDLLACVHGIDVTTRHFQF